MGARLAQHCPTSAAAPGVPVSALEREVWGTDEIGQYTGRKKSAVSVLVNQPGFPGPCMGTHRCRRWFKDSVIAYLRSQERTNASRAAGMSDGRRSFRVSVKA